MLVAKSVRHAVPAIDDVVRDYAAGYAQFLENSAEDPSRAQSLQLEQELSFLQQLLESAGGDSHSVATLIGELRLHLSPLQQKNAGRTYGSAATRKLDAETLMNAQRNNAMNRGLQDKPLELDLLNSNRTVESRVDRKKLEKAEKKLAAKIAKREKGFMKELQYEQSKLLETNTEENYDEFFLTVNPLDLGPSEGKTKDIKLENFDLYVGEGQRVLADANLTLSHGRRYGLVGANGIGKSTLLKALSRRELSVPKHITILYVEQEVTGDERSALQTVLDADVWRKHLLKEQERINSRLTQILEELDMSQNQSDEATLKVLNEEADDLNAQIKDVYAKLEEIDSDSAESRAAEILTGLGFSLQAQQQASNTFSGGWRMRLSLARALFCEPDLLMLDEPSNMLDLPSITFLSNYLLTYPSTVLVVSHDRAFLNDIATDIIHQHNERLDYYRGCNFDSFYASKEERFKTAKREYENQMAYRKHLQEFIDKFRYNAAKSSEAQSRIKKLEKLPVLEEPQEETAAGFKFSDPDQISPPILQLSNVKFGYTPEKLLLHEVDISVDMQSRIALVGGNGCGKTTLLKLLMDKLSPQDGHVSRHPRLRIGYFAQHHVDGMDLSLTATEWMAKVKPGKSSEEYRRLLGAFGITGSLGLRKLAHMSGGQKSRVAFATLALSDPHILVLDEPSNHLDIAGLDALAEALKNFKGGILMVSHDVATIRRVCNEIFVSENGRVYKFKGSVDDYKKYILGNASKAGVVAKH